MSPATFRADYAFGRFHADDPRLRELIDGTDEEDAEEWVCPHCNGEREVLVEPCNPYQRAFWAACECTGVYD